MSNLTGCEFPMDAVDQGSLDDLVVEVGSPGADGDYVPALPPVVDLVPALGGFGRSTIALYFANLSFVGRWIVLHLVTWMHFGLYFVGDTKAKITQQH